jgi:hypothetical protein
MQLGSKEVVLVILLFTGMGLSVLFRKLTVLGALTGGLLAFLIYLGAGYTGIGLMAAFFLLGTLATGHRMQVKQVFKAAEKAGGRRRLQKRPAVGEMRYRYYPMQAYPPYLVCWHLAFPNTVPPFAYCWLHPFPRPLPIHYHPSWEPYMVKNSTI